jgi:hypothetical protein
MAFGIRVRCNFYLCAPVVLRNPVGEAESVHCRIYALRRTVGEIDPGLLLLLPQEPRLKALPEKINFFPPFRHRTQTFTQHLLFSHHLMNSHSLPFFHFYCSSLFLEISLSWNLSVSKVHNICVWVRIGKN